MLWQRTIDSHQEHSAAISWKKIMPLRFHIWFSHAIWWLDFLDLNKILFRGNPISGFFLFVTIHQHRLLEKYFLVTVGNGFSLNICSLINISSYSNGYTTSCIIWSWRGLGLDTKFHHYCNPAVMQYKTFLNPVDLMTCELHNKSCIQADSVCIVKYITLCALIQCIISNRHWHLI